jgi:hypothetical protein
MGLNEMCGNYIYDLKRRRIRATSSEPMTGSAGQQEKGTLDCGAFRRLTMGIAIYASRGYPFPAEVKALAGL